jgi:cystathionine beta-lyase
VAPDSLVRAVAGWQRTRHGWDVGEDAVTWAPGVVAGLAFSLMAYTKPGDGVIIQTPVYPPFYATIKEAGRRVVKNPLKREDARYVMDLEGREKLITPTCRTPILCKSPHPVARVWAKWNWSRADLAVRKICYHSDEIHQDIVYIDAKHTCIASLSMRWIANSPVLAPSKTFNIAGMKHIVALIPDEKLMARYVSVLNRLHLGSSAYSGSLRWRRPFKVRGWLTS